MYDGREHTYITYTTVENMQTLHVRGGVAGYPFNVGICACLAREMFARNFKKNLLTTLKARWIKLNSRPVIS